jgi:predicted phosphodiesterase
VRIAVLADIHANLTALEAVVDDIQRQAPDVVIVGGDLVGNGSRPAEVVDCIRALGWPVIQGNSDEMLWNAARSLNARVVIYGHIHTSFVRPMT